MKIFIVALLLAIGYAQTAGMDMSMLMPCKNRPADKCSGNSMEGVCRMNYNKVPARCEEGDPMDREDICASLQADACKAEKSCCWSMRDNFFGKCSAIEMEMFGEMEFEDCPSSMLPRIFPSMGGADAGTSGAADSSSGDSSASGAADASSGDSSASGATDASSGDSSSGAADASSGDSSSGAADASSGSASGSATADQTQQASTYPFMTPNPPMSERTQTMLSCEVAGMQGPAACNALKAGNMFNPKVCGWNVKEGGCEEIELGKGNLCKTVADQETCNQQGDCCWDMKGYCGEYDFGDCMRPMPNMGNLMPNMGNLMPNMGNMGGMSNMIGMEEQMEAHAEMAEANAEMAENHAEMMGEMGGMQMGPGGMMMETEIEYEELPPVQSCDGLQFCHGREGMSPCVLDAQQKCVKMNMPSFGAPALRKTHTSQDSAPFNYGHLLMVLGGGLIVGLAAGMCFQNIRSKNSIAPVLLEDNYRNI